MKTGLLGLLLLFTVVTGYAELNCDAPEYKDNPVMHDSCVNMQKAIQEKIKQVTDNFSEGINKARARISNARMQQAMNAAAATTPPANGMPTGPAGAGAMPGNLPAPPAATAPVINPPQAPVNELPAAAPPPPIPVQPPTDNTTAPNTTSKANSSTKTVKYY